MVHPTQSSSSSSLPMMSRVLLLLQLMVMATPTRGWLSSSAPAAANNRLLQGRNPLTRTSNRNHYQQATRRYATIESSSSSQQANGASSSCHAPQNDDDNEDDDDLFDDFVDFLLDRQATIIQQVEDLERKYDSTASFSKDTWGMFDDPDQEDAKPIGGITRVIQGGTVIEKGACSFTLIGQGTLSKERAATIRARQNSEMEIQEGDEYAAAALSMVLHSKSPHVPTFRSDVRVFMVKQKTSRTTTTNDNPKEDDDNSSPSSMAWFGGGADLTPYFLEESDILFFHQMYKDLCDKHQANEENDDNDNEEQLFSYETMKQSCDDYFFLPARQEHRGTGGIFFDDMDMTDNSLEFVKGVADLWMPSWIPIVEQRIETPVTDRQRQWQLLRRGRYLEFNLLYDRGVKFGLANANPRVEGVMVSAPPLIAFEYNHPIEEGSPEAQLMKVLKSPRNWV